MIESGTAQQQSLFETAHQQSLFIETQTRYGWKSIKDLQRNDLIVISDKEVKIQNIKRDGDFWQVSYADPQSGEKAEQLYTETDFVYSRL